MQLAGKRALVTGAGRGLGLAIARVFAERGCSVILADIDGEAAERGASAIGAAASGVRCDVTVADDVRAAVAATVAAFGGLDILVNNAGVEIGKPLVEHEEDEFDRLMAINVKGVFLGAKHAVPALAAEGGGVILNMASVAGLGGAPLLGAYCASKAAVVRMTQVLAVELRDVGIRVNAICPAFIDTTMVDRLVAPFEAATQVPFDELVALRQGRLGSAEEVAEMAAFLAADEAGFVTGSTYILDGGLTAGVL